MELESPHGSSPDNYQCGSNCFLPAPSSPKKADVTGKPCGATVGSIQDLFFFSFWVLWVTLKMFRDLHFAQGSLPSVHRDVLCQRADESAANKASA